MRVAVIGAGAAGREFAAACAVAGFQVVLEDVMPEKLRNAAAVFASLGFSAASNSRFPSGMTTEEQSKPTVHGEVELVATVEDAVRDADVAVDFVPDELESKLEIWSMIDRMAPPKTVMLTPSQELSITDLSSCTYRADRCVMVRGKVPGAVRLLSAKGTSDETREIAAAVLRAIGCEVEAEGDPDLPMLLKNMRVAGI